MNSRFRAATERRVAEGPLIAATLEPRARLTSRGTRRLWSGFGEPAISSREFAHG